MDKKKRAPNFSSNEKTILAELMKEYYSIIESKMSNSVSRTEKAECWTQLASHYNSISGYAFRSVESLRVAWDNLKKNARKSASLVKKELYRTGGGVSTAPPINKLDEEVLRIIGVSATGVEHQFDSDYMDDVEVPTQYLSSNVEIPHVRPPAVPQTEVASSSQKPSVQCALEESVLEYTLEDGVLLPVGASEKREDSSEALLGNSNTWKDVVPRMLYSNKHPALKRAADRTSKLANEENLAKVLKRRRPTLSLSDELVEEKIRLTKAMREGQEIENQKKEVELELLKLELYRKSREVGIREEEEVVEN